MDWSNEPYVRLYREDSPEWMMLPWQSRLLWPALLKIVDRAGILPVGRSGAKAVAAKIQVPLDVVEPGIAGLLDDGCLLKAPDGKGGDLLVVRNFILAQEATQSDAARKRLQRERRSAEAKALALGLAVVVGADAPPASVTECDQDVTSCDSSSRNVPPPSRAVTSGHERSLSLSSAVQGSAFLAPPAVVPPESTRARVVERHQGDDGTTAGPGESPPSEGPEPAPGGGQDAPWQSGPGVRTYRPVRRLATPPLPPLTREDLGPTGQALLDALGKHERAFGRLAGSARLADGLAGIVDTSGTHTFVEQAIGYAAAVVGREEASRGAKLDDDEVARIVTGCVNRAGQDRGHGRGRSAGPEPAPARPRRWTPAEGAR